VKKFTWSWNSKLDSLEKIHSPIRTCSAYIENGFNEKLDENLSWEGALPFFTEISHELFGKLLLVEHP
jgi:hypothetical protein